MTVEITMVERALELSRDNVPAGAVTLETWNGGARPHEVILIRLPAGATPDAALAGDVPMDQIEFIGGAYAMPGQAGRFVLLDLTPGIYTLICYVDAPDGVPDVLDGMIAQLTVA